MGKKALVLALDQVLGLAIVTMSKIQMTNYDEGAD